MRSVSYVQRVALDFSGSLFPHAICLGDVDNDTLNELVVGDTSGKLSVYKNDDSRPWLTCSCQGMLTCVGVGDVCNKGKNLVVAVSAEGWFHLCDLTPARTLDASGHHETLMGEEQRLVFKQHIPANTKVMLISDIDGDGCCELVVGYTDRVVRAFRWEDLGEGTEHLTGQLVSLKKWTLEGQVDSLSVTLGPLGVPELMVSQPGCAYAVLLCTWNKDARHSTTSEGTMEGIRETPAARDVVLHQTSGRIHNKNVSTHLIGNIKRGHTAENGGSGLFALCTLDGTLKLMEEADKLLWATGMRRWLPVPGTGRRISSITTAQSSASKWMRMSEPSVQACMPAKRATTAPASCMSHSTRRSMCTGRCSLSGWSLPIC
ncbi:KICSTOR complex protein ITFG2 isoform X2 [Eptesicus fuscus]|uniref:KICSTOR complex protein ITFG2 isoform X2 n=1 Tax=Eptesicus fuscus TaxID=29078 RepID=UPI002404719C|nr:KICSTOR complex protein ITFG2 isoform X2 [Eptesicus fuscus]